MARPDPKLVTWSDRAVFLREFLRHPRQVASIIPSTRFLARRVIDALEPTRVRTVVELGPGTGGMTRALLASLPAEARLLAVEINPSFAARVRRIGDDRLLVAVGSAEELPAILEANGLSRPDAVVCGLPFSMLGAERSDRIIAAVDRSLATGGRFVAYHIRGLLETLARPHFGEGEAAFEWRSFPPMRIYRWRKSTVAAAAVARQASRRRLTPATR